MGAPGDFLLMPILPLVLALEPLLPTRSPSGQRKEFRSGYQLRFPGGPAIGHDDPLLAVFGAEFVWLTPGGEHDEPIQSGSFDPGARLRPVYESLDDDGDPVVAIWDAEQLHRGGMLPYTVAARVAAALDHGLDVELISLQESRTALDVRRVGLGVLVCSPSMVRVKQPKPSRAIRPARRARRRVVLLADGSGQVRWWDPTAASGPAEITQLPVSSYLQAELDQLGAESATLARRAQDAPGDSAGWSSIGTETRSPARRSLFGSGFVPSSAATTRSAFSDPGWTGRSGHRQSWATSTRTTGRRSDRRWSAGPSAARSRSAMTLVEDVRWTPLPVTP